MRGFLGLAALVAVLAALLQAPHANSRVLRWLSRGREVLEEIYLLALGDVSVKTRGAFELEKESASFDVSSAQRDELKQPLAKNEEEIDHQQRVSAQRYAAAKQEAQFEEESIPLPPDEIRRSMPPIDRRGPELRCGELLPTESRLVTRMVEIHTRSVFQGAFGGNQYVWKYFVTFTNRGEETVQMLTRHWIFVDAKGNLNAEVKGPGARGVTPVLPPGGEWSYESGTSLDTVFGSMHGSFQFDILKGSTSGSGSRSFSARVGRLALSNDGKPKDVPCIEEASEGLLPLTSVLSLERVILGARGEFHMAKDGLYYFQYDVQINNARDTEIEVLGHSWEVVDQEQRHEIVVAGDGVGGIYKHRRRALAAGDAFRVSGQLPAKTRFANAQGTYRVLIRENGAEREIEARTDFMGLSVDKAITHVPNFMSDPSFQ
ncbi:unnamed protein product [Durusdinium trenchii]|uniref:ApaG domain-containing protein n=1 Tax=Durusdinium trenchii TaxID=1381693 RepID=A0ABP0KL00_9DINO